MPPALLLPLLLLLATQYPLPGSCTDAAVRAGAGPSVEVFSFDYAWTPARPLPNDTVVFQASAPPSQVARWGLTDGSFRWYQQLPGSGFQLRHVGRSYSRRAGEAYFEGRYRLRVSVEEAKPEEQQRQQAWDNELLVDVVKYVGLQKQVEIALLTNGTAGLVAGGGSNGSSSGSGSRHKLVCRFWGWPLVDTLQFLPPAGSVCDRRHFETAESEPHIDLVLSCPKLLPGTYSCYGRNAVSAAQLSCELSGPGLSNAGCYRPSLGSLRDAAPASGDAAADRKSLPPEAKRAAAESAASGNARLQGTWMVTMVTGCIAMVLLCILR